MHICVAYRAIPGRKGWETGAELADEFRQLGHAVTEYATVHTASVPLDAQAYRKAQSADLLVYLECNDGDSQYSELRHLPCRKIYWTFDDALYAERARQFVDWMGIDVVCHANYHSTDWGTRKSGWMPYAISRQCAKWIGTPKTRDVVMVGTATPERTEFVEQLRKRGIAVELISGLYGDDNLRTIAEARVGLHYAGTGGKGLLVQRIFDTIGVGTELVAEHEAGLMESVGLCGFRDIDGAVWQIEMALKHGTPEPKMLSCYERHTMRSRAEAILAL